MKIGFIGFGDAACGITKGLLEESEIEVVVYTHNYDKAVLQCKKLGKKLKYEVVKNIHELIKKTDVVCIAVPCDVNQTVIGDIIKCGNNTNLFIDFCSCTPTRKRENEQKIKLIGGKYVDASIMDAVRKKLHKTPIIISGSGSDTMIDVFDEYHMNIKKVGTEAGKSALIKLCRSIFIKGIIALAIETENVSKKYNVFNEVFESIAESWNTNEFMDYMGKQMIGAKQHCRRMKVEVEQCYLLEKETGGEGYMTKGTIELYEQLIQEME